MKNKISLFIFAVSAFFILMGVGTILKGDIENTKEGLIMAAYLLFFVSMMVIAKWSKLEKLFPGKQ